MFILCTFDSPEIYISYMEKKMQKFRSLVLMWLLSLTINHPVEETKRHSLVTVKHGKMFVVWSMIRLHYLKWCQWNLGLGMKESMDVIKEVKWRELDWSAGMKWQTSIGEIEVDCDRLEGIRTKRMWDNDYLSRSSVSLRYYFGGWVFSWNKI